VACDWTVDEARDFMPLQVDFREKLFASGRFPEGPQRREPSATDAEVLGGRLVDRALRPLFPPGFFYETHVRARGAAYSTLRRFELAACVAPPCAPSLPPIPTPRRPPCPPGGAAAPPHSPSLAAVIALPPSSSV